MWKMGSLCFRLAYIKYDNAESRQSEIKSVLIRISFLMEAGETVAG